MQSFRFRNMFFVCNGLRIEQLFHIAPLCAAHLFCLAFVSSQTRAKYEEEEGHENELCL